jgi:hypothetical protein
MLMHRVFAMEVGLRMVESFNELRRTEASGRATKCMAADIQFQARENLRPYCIEEPQKPASISSLVAGRN